MRPRLSEAPAAVRALLVELLGEPVRLEVPADAGFTPSVASTVTCVSGKSVFVKAGPARGGLDEPVRTGALLAPLIGDVAPRLLATGETEDWVLAVYEHVPGQTLVEWGEPAVEAMLGVLAVIRERLAGPALPGAVRFADAFAPMLGTWASLAHRQGGDPSTVAHLGVEMPAQIAVGQLANLEAEWFTVLGPGEAMQHGDLRRDNIIRDNSNDQERLWVADWTHLWTGPGWLDLVRLGPDMADSGRDPEAVLGSSCWADADAHAINVALAGLAGRAWRDSHHPDLPSLRRMQRKQAVHALRWLARRLRSSQ